MLDDLMGIPWSNLQHAYGSAMDVPDLIRSLLSSDKNERFQARRTLSESINHQGTGYQATPYVTPFLAELSQNGDVCDRHLIIYNLVSIAIGIDCDFLPFGFNVEAFRRSLQTRASKVSSKRRSHIAMGPHIELACYDGVSSRAGVFVALLSDRLEDVRVASTFALAWFPECREGLPAVTSQLQQLGDTQHRERANLALSYGLLCFHSGVRPEASLLDGLLDHPLLYVRVAAAIALAKTDPSQQVLSVLSEGSQSKQLQNLYELVPFNEGNLQSYAARVLGEVSPQ
jgi:hypothetical protein